MGTSRTVIILPLQLWNVYVCMRGVCMGAHEHMRRPEVGVTLHLLR